MARKNLLTTPEDELEATASETSSRKRSYEEYPLDARMLELDDEAESPFLRGQKRVPVRRGALPRKTAGILKIALVGAAIVGSLALISISLHQYATGSWRFRMESSNNIAMSGMNHVGRSQVLDVMASDLDRNIFFVPLELRKKQLEQIPWVASASVMRLLPNQLKVVLCERTPVAFIQINSHIQLVDASGVIMEPPANSQTSYSFPVIVGMSEAEPLSTRAARMKIYAQLMTDLDASGAHYSHDLSDVDLSDPDDVKATVTDPHGVVLVHLGSSNFRERFQIYVAHVQEWRAQFQKLQSVDLRYEHQVIVNPDSSPAIGHGSASAAEGKSGATPDKAAPLQKKKKHS